MQAHLVQVKTCFSKHKKKNKNKTRLYSTNKKKKMKWMQLVKTKLTVFTVSFYILSPCSRGQTHTCEQKPAATLPDWIVISLCTMLKGSFTRSAKSTVKCAQNQTQEWSTSRKSPIKPVMLSPAATPPQVVLLTFPYSQLSCLQACACPATKGV